MGDYFYAPRTICYNPTARNTMFYLLGPIVTTAQTVLDKTIIKLSVGVLAAGAVSVYLPSHPILQTATLIVTFVVWTVSSKVCLYIQKQSIFIYKQRPSLSFSGSYESTLSMNQDLLAMQLRNREEPQQDLAATYDRIAGTLRMMRRNEEALQHYQQAIAILQAVLDSKESAVASIRYELGLITLLQEAGECSSSLGNPQQALEFHERALKATNSLSAEAFQTPEHRKNPEEINHEREVLRRDIYWRIGKCQRLLGKLPEARESYQKYLTALQGQEPTVQMAACQYEIGLCFEAEGNLEEARRHFQAAVEIGQKTLALEDSRLRSYSAASERSQEK